jgi:methionyl-tRNA formyltransferase
VAVVLAYGRILPPPVLRAPRRGCMNLHASLLPKLRGAAPIHRAILGGETETGISLMQMDEGMDTGPVYAARRIPIGAQETAGELEQRLAELAALVVRDELPRAARGELLAVAQDDRLATHAPPLGPADRRIDWTRPAHEIANQVRGLEPRPGALTGLRGKLLRIRAARPSDQPDAAPPGTVVRAGRSGVLVATGGGALQIERAQLEGRKAVAARDLVNGRQIAEGDVLGPPAC